MENVYSHGKNCALFLSYSVRLITLSLSYKNWFHYRICGFAYAMSCKRWSSNDRKSRDEQSIPRCIEPSAMRHPGTTLSSFHDSFYLSHLSRDPRLANVCVGAGWNSVGVIYCSRGGRVEYAASRRLVEFAIKKINAMEGISPEKLIFYSSTSLGLSPSFVIH